MVIFLCLYIEINVDIKQNNHILKIITILIHRNTSFFSLSLFVSSPLFLFVVFNVKPKFQGRNHHLR